MKKYLLLASVAALAFTSCSDQSTEFVGDEAAQKAREISFAPIAKPTTRAAIQGTTFPAANTMEVTAYQSAPATASNYFTKTTFSESEGLWVGGKYWPLSPATINFFAVSGAGVAATDITIADALATAGVDYTAAKSYSQTTQSDIMYAFNRGVVTKPANALVYNNVSMEFKHALALVNFQIKGSTAITVNSITLNDASYTGTLALSNSAAVTETSGTVTTTVSWTPDTSVDAVAVPVISDYTLTGTFYPATDATWASLIIVPKASSAYSGFTINYTYNGKSYSYTYIDDHAAVAGYKYNYEITMTLNEIKINPTVTNWDSQTPTGVSVG